jgi:predicted GIY-YIG superfamily endonuclease
VRNWRSYYPNSHTGSRWVVLDPSAYPLPAIPACYVFYGDGRLLYVGQTTDFKARMKSHNVRLRYSNGYTGPWGDYREMSVKVHFGIAYGDWAMRELRLIQRLRPEFNRQHKPKLVLVA